LDGGGGCACLFLRNHLDILQGNNMCRKKLNSKYLYFVLIVLFFAAGHLKANIIKGVVYEDKNCNGTMDKNEKPLAGIAVSNGLQIVRTDKKGNYELSAQQGDVIFVIKPTGWTVSKDKLNIPRFYYINNEQNAPTSVNFALYKNSEPKNFDVIIFGDPQIKNERELGYFAHDAVEEVMNTKAAFGVILGDLVFDNLGLYEDINRCVSLLDTVFYRLPGNHDMNYDAPDDEHSLETYKSLYGPPYYSFDYANVHFLILDNIIAKRIDDKWMRYEEGLTDRQLEFVKNDLSLVAKDKLVVVMGHAAFTQFLKNKKELLDVLAKFPNTLSVAGHLHTTENLFLKSQDGWDGKQPHHVYISGAVCGGWWQGFPGENGIPHSMMTNGVPNGYSVISFDNNKYSIKFKAFGKDENYQMSVYLPDETTPQDAAKTEVVVNVFAGSEKSTVEMSFDSENVWHKMEREPSQSQYHIDVVKEEEKYGFPRYDWSKDSKISEHIWKAYLPAGLSVGTHVIHFRTVDMYGQTYTAKRIFRIK
jgi:signal peptidase I